MSRALAAAMEEIRKRIKKSRSPEDTKFVRFFGATDAYVNYTERLERASRVAFNTVLNPGLQIPSSLPIPVDSGFGLPGAEQVQRQTPDAVQAPMVLSKEKDSVRASSSDNAHHNGFDRPLDEDNLEELLTFLADSGLKAREVKTLPSGAMKITLDDLKMEGLARKPEFAELGR